MRYKLFIFLLVGLANILAMGQTQINPHTQIKWPALTGSGSPPALSVGCSSLNYGEPYTDISVTPNIQYECGTGGWFIVSNVNGKAISPSSILVTGSLPVSVPSGLYGYGSLGYNDSNTIQAYAASVNNYFQAVIQNTSSGSSASADYIVSNNLGTSNSYYGDFGINSSTFSGSGSGALPNAIYMTANNGDLVFGTNTNNLIRFYVNGSATDSLRITSAGVIQIPGIAAGSSTNCLQIDTSGNISNTGSACGAGSGGLSGMTAGQIPVAATATTVTGSKAIQGTDSSLLSAGTVSGTGAALCTDSNGGATTSGCSSGSGTVSSGTATQIGYYAANGSTISPDTNITDSGNTFGYTGSQGITAQQFVGDNGVNAQQWTALYRAGGCPAVPAHSYQLCAATDPGPTGISYNLANQLPTPVSNGNTALVSNSGGTPSWQPRTVSIPIYSGSVTNITTTTGTNYISYINIPKYAVAYGGKLYLDVSCKVSVITAMTASTFTAQISFYDVATTAYKGLMSAAASPTVTAGTSNTINFTRVILGAPASGIGFYLVGGQASFGTAQSSNSILGSGPYQNVLSYGTGTLANDSTGNNELAVSVITSVNNTTPNTAQCNISADVVNP